MSLKIVHTDKAPPPSVRIRRASSPTAFSSPPVRSRSIRRPGRSSPATSRAQTERVMTNLAAVLATVGATWKDVVKTTVFLHDMNDFPIVNEVYGKRTRRRAAGALHRAGRRRCRAACWSRSTRSSPFRELGAPRESLARRS